MVVVVEMVDERLGNNKQKHSSDSSHEQDSCLEERMVTRNKSSSPL